MNLVYPDYSNSIVNLSNSILRKYNVDTMHPSLEKLDSILKSKEYKNIILLIYDGLGTTMLNKYLDNSFLIKNKLMDITSVFPATTTTATTSLLTGLNPIEHCWLGWDIYVESLDKIVTAYCNSIKGSLEPLAPYSICHNEFPFVSIVDLINKKKKANAYYLSPHAELSYDRAEPDVMYDKIFDLCQNDGQNFVYVYCEEPDHAMHSLGIDDTKVVQMVKHFDEKVFQLSQKLKDTLIIVTADHGLVNVKEYIFIEDYPEIANMLVRDMAMEQRAAMFFVKPQFLDIFKLSFIKHLGNDFMLFSRQELLEQKFFGSGIEHEKLSACLGDYVAVSISGKSLLDRRKANYSKAHHAGMTKDEMIVPVITIST